MTADHRRTAGVGTPRRDVLAGTGRWFARHRASILTCIVLGVAFVASLIPVQLHEPQYAPDTRYYAAMALHFAGFTPEEAHAQVEAYTTESGWSTPPTETLFGWGLVQPRVVYPLLSVPFVKLFGIAGMAVVPILAMAALVVAMVWIIRDRYRSIGVIAVALLVIASPKLMFFGTASLTESLTALWCTGILAVVWRHQATGRRRWLVAAAGFTLLMAFTRQATLIPAAALGFAWLAAVVLRDRPRRWWWPALVVGTTTVATQVVQTLVWPTFSQFTQYMEATNTESLGAALRATPALVRHILVRDFDNYLRADHALLTIVVLSAVAVVVLWRRAEAHLLVGAFVAISFYNVTNGTPTTFRYAMPGLIFFALAIAALLERATPDGFGSTPGPDAWRGSGWRRVRDRAEDPRPHRHEVEHRDHDHRDELREVRLDPEAHEARDQAAREGQVHRDEDDVPAQRSAAVPHAEHERPVAGVVEREGAGETER